MAEHNRQRRKITTTFIIIRTTANLLSNGHENMTRGAPKMNRNSRNNTYDGVIGWACVEWGLVGF